MRWESVKSSAIRGAFKIYHHANDALKDVLEEEKENLVDLWAENLFDE